MPQKIDQDRTKVSNKRWLNPGAGDDGNNVNKQISVKKEDVEPKSTNHFAPGQERAANVSANKKKGARR